MKVVIDQTQKKLTGLDEPLPRDDDQLPSTLSLQFSVHWQTQTDNVFNHFTGCRKHQIDILNWKRGGACAECARMKMNWNIKITKNYISVHKNRQTNMFILILQAYVLHFKHTSWFNWLSNVLCVIMWIKISALKVITTTSFLYIYCSRCGCHYSLNFKMI